MAQSIVEYSLFARSAISRQNRAGLAWTFARLTFIVLGDEELGGAFSDANFLCFEVELGSGAGIAIPVVGS